MTESSFCTHYLVEIQNHKQFIINHTQLVYIYDGYCRRFSKFSTNKEFFIDYENEQNILVIRILPVFNEFKNL